ncbi:uncharacterized protein LOC120334140 isoform X2 [Styela clava]
MSSYGRGSGEFPKDIRVEIPLEHPHEGRNNPQPTKGFMAWKVPSRYAQGRGDSREDLFLDDMERVHTAGSHFSRPQHGATQTTHFAPPHGKFEPIKSEQQEHMEEIKKKEAALRKHLADKSLTLPNIARSAPVKRTTRSRQSDRLTLEPRTYSAAQRWLKKNPGQEELANKVLRQTSRTEVDKLLEHTLQPNAKKAVREWLKTASEADRQAALKFFRSIGGSRLLGGPSGYHPDRNIHGDRDARLMAVINALQEKHGQPNQARATAMDDKLATLMKAAHRKHLRLLSPNTRVRRTEFQTWHHMPVYPCTGPVENVLSMYTKPRAPYPQSFRIHPEWGA